MVFIGGNMVTVCKHSCCPWPSWGLLGPSWWLLRSSWGRIGGPVSGQVGHLRQIAVRMGGWTRPAWPSVRGQGLLNLVGETFEPIRSELSNLDGPCACQNGRFACPAKQIRSSSGPRRMPTWSFCVPCRANAHAKWALAHARMAVLRALP